MADSLLVGLMWLSLIFFLPRPMEEGWGEGKKRVFAKRPY